MFTWVLKHKETLALIFTYIGGAWAGFRFIHRKWYKPIKAFFDRLKRVMAELEDNGGGSTKDRVRNFSNLLLKISKDVSLIKAAQDANFQLNPDCIFQCAPDSRCIMVNESICRLFGAERDEMLGFGWTSFIHEDEREDAKKYWKDSVLTDNVINSEYTIVNGYTQEEIPCVYTAYVKRNSDGEIISIFGIVNRK